MKEDLNPSVYQEVWYILKKLPLNLVSKIPFDIRNKIAEEAQKSSLILDNIDTSVNLQGMNISQEAKEVLSVLFIDYLSDEDTKNKLQEFIKFCDNK